MYCTVINYLNYSIDSIAVFDDSLILENLSAIIIIRSYDYEWLEKLTKTKSARATNWHTRIIEV